MKYWFMDQQHSWHGVQRMCRVLRASRSGYYAWKRQPQSKRQKENEKVLMEIKESHKNSRMAYGSPRITKDIQARGTRCSENSPWRAAIDCYRAADFGGRAGNSWFLFLRKRTDSYFARTYNSYFVFQFFEFYLCYGFLKNSCDDSGLKV
jgi:hypothetical protein